MRSTLAPHNRAMHRSLILVRRRLLQAIPVLAVVAIGVFFLIELAPGDAVDAYMAVDRRRRCGLRAARCARNGASRAPGPPGWAAISLNLLTLNLGQSLAFSQPVSHLIADRILNTLMLTVSGLGVAAGLGTIFGVAAAARPGSLRDLLLTGIALVLNATPGFFVGLLALLLFSVKLAWLPLNGISSLSAPQEGLGHVCRCRPASRPAGLRPRPHLYGDLPAADAGRHAARRGQRLCAHGPRQGPGAAGASSGGIWRATPSCLS